MSLTVSNFELFLLVLVRISGFIYTAPIFSQRTIPQKVKVGLSLFISILIVNTITINEIAYIGVIGFAILVVLEALAGVIMGYSTNLAYYILAFVGKMIDTGIGFAMANIMDPITKAQTTITANFYGYIIFLMMIITDLHHYFIMGIIDSFKIIPIGKVNIRPQAYNLILDFVIDYFIIGFRIIVPIIASILIVNTILAILAKVAPQMNLFAVGIQIKVLIGLMILVFMIGFVPSVADFIFNEMIEMLKNSLKYLA